MTISNNPNDATSVNNQPPDWHREYLKGREDAVATEEDSFITLDEFENDLRLLLKEAYQS